MRDNLPCTEMCKCQGCTNKQEEAIAEDEVDGEDIEEEENYSENNTKKRRLFHACLPNQSSLITVILLINMSSLCNEIMYDFILILIVVSIFFSDTFTINLVLVL